MNEIRQLNNNGSPVSVRLAYFIGDKPYYAALREGEIVDIPDEIRKCVVFAAFERDGEKKICGTIFLVGAELAQGRALQYAVTAKHVIDKIRERATDPRSMFIRANIVNGGCEYIKIPTDIWRFHEDERNDVAVAEIRFRDNLDHLVYPMSQVHSSDSAMRSVGIGTDLFFVGLFSRHNPDSKNIPIVRAGNIAAMPDPDAKIRTKAGWMEAYLVESRSIGGLSGSPVFVYQPPKLIGLVVDGIREVEPRTFNLLGLIHGHCESADCDEPEEDALTNEMLNSGIAVVVPSSKIGEVLDCAEFANNRSKLKKEIELKLTVVPDNIANKSQ